MKLVAFTPPKVTFVVCVRLTPAIVTAVPTGPLVGVKLVICGIMRKTPLLESVALGVVTLTLPVVATAGTVALSSELNKLEQDQPDHAKAKSRAGAEWGDGVPPPRKHRQRRAPRPEASCSEWSLGA